MEIYEAGEHEMRGDVTPEWEVWDRGALIEKRGNPNSQRNARLIYERYLHYFVNYLTLSAIPLTEGRST